MSVSEQKMRKSSDSLKRRGWQQLMLIGCCCALLFTVAQAEAGAQENKSKDAALELKLSAYESRVCSRSAITLSLEITNTSQEALKIYKLDLWSQFSYRAVGSNVGGSSISCGIYDGRAENWVVLEPGAQYRDTLTYHLDWNDFFKAAGRYQISTRVSYYYTEGKYSRTAKSSEVEFEVYDCAAK